MQVTEGSKWSSSDGKKFTVIHVVEQDGHTWVHYRNESKEPKEYSCYLESFVSRFRSIPE